MPKPGKWRVDVEASEPRLRASVNVEVEPEDVRAFVAIELPDTRVYGKVVDASGTPAAGATVGLSSAISTLETEADQKGDFEFRAFPAGAAELFASRAAGQAGREASDTYLFETAGQSLPEARVKRPAPFKLRGALSKRLRTGS